MITAQIIQTIKEKAETIPQIQEVIMHPEGADITEVEDGKLVYKGTRVTNYPALVFLKDTFNSNYSDTGSNERTVNFKGWVIVPVDNIENQDVWERILPNATDAVLEKFDKGWDFGTIGGFRVWARMDSGLQGYTPESDGRVAWEEINLVIRYSVSVV